MHHGLPVAAAAVFRGGFPKENNALSRRPSRRQKALLVQMREVSLSLT
jgi:hypothetical protein